ncbi:hypothetical protein H072_6348 [Dactylellina haptotyla CBS 200.50]|uniref:Amidohydrolase 3 domain-containing protein n=1 Tax=Dactylellina haptotyla (strain CBS 200.50) TaxID=1284197 RepID=S8BKD6_DACHA|nr:hypothetical protein H072_6348 [Dactylellina haptotyla CBS 200.50]
MGFLGPDTQIRLLALIALFLNLISVSTAHSTGDDEPESCLASHIRVAKALGGDLSDLQFNLEDITPESWPYSLERAESSDSSAVPTIFYSNEQPRPIITMAGRRLSAVEAMAIQDDKVLAVGSLEAVVQKAGNRRFFVDLGSQVIVPGFVEPHIHTILSAFLNGYLINISPLKAPTYDDAMATLRAGLSNLTEGQWLVAYGYDPSRLGWHDLTFKDLDENVSSTVPVFIVNASGHIAYANKKAFAIAGVTRNSTNPPGGEYARDQNGDLTGVIVEIGAIAVFSKPATIANQGRQKLIQPGIQKLLGTWLSKGVTTVFDAGIGTLNKTTDVQIVANITNASPIRIFGAIADFIPGDAEIVLGKGCMPDGGHIFGNLTVKTVKLWTDGSTQGFTAAVNSPYKLDHFPTYFGNRTTGVLVWPDGQSKANNTSSYNTTMRQEMTKWMRRGYQIMLHSNGDRASQIVLDNFAAIYAQDPSLKAAGILHRIEHFTVTEPSQILQAKALGLAVSHTMGHVHYWGDAFNSSVLGPARAERIDPIKDDVDAGLIYSFHSDSPVTDVNPLLWVSTAITRKVYKSGNVLGTGQRVGLYDALKGVTANPARQILRDSELGTLEVGKMADFVVLSEDLRVFDWEGRNVEELKVVETWIGGRKRYPLAA